MRCCGREGRGTRGEKAEREEKMAQMKEKMGVMREGKEKKRAVEDWEGVERKRGWKVEIGKVEMIEKMIEENF